MLTLRERVWARSPARRSRSSAMATTSPRRSRTPAPCSASTCASRRRPATSCRRSVVDGGSQRRAPRRDDRGHERRATGRRRRRCGLHGRVGVDGPGGQADDRARVFAPFQVNDDADGRRRPATRCSCTACRRIAASKSPTAVMDSPASVVFDQAENRLHTQKALLALLMG